MKTETLIELQRSITQGEWIVQNEGSQSIIVSRADIEQPAVARIYNHNCPRSVANARAIALVPELIAEVIRLREALESYRSLEAIPAPAGIDAEWWEAQVGRAAAALANDK